MRYIYTDFTLSLLLNCPTVLRNKAYYHNPTWPQWKEMLYPQYTEHLKVQDKREYLDIG